MSESPVPNPDNGQRENHAVGRAIASLAAGGVVILPTDTVYGIAGRADDDGAWQRLRAFSMERVGRQPTGIAIHLPRAEDARHYVDLSHPVRLRAAMKLLTGPVTVTFEMSEDEIAERASALGFSARVRDRLYAGGRVSLRCPDVAVTAEVLAGVSAPVVAIGLVDAHQRPARSEEEASAAARSWDAEVTVLLGGQTRYGRGSTQVRVDSVQRQGVPSYHVVREGVFDRRIVEKLMRWTMLLVCSGNTCRSPMAEGLAREMIAEKRGVRPEALEQLGIHVVSAGTFAAPGSPATPEAVEAAAALGADLTQHRSRPITPEMVHEADVIYTMTASHRDALLSMDPALEAKTHRLLGDRDVSDPIGSSSEVYHKTAEMIRDGLVQRLAELPI